MKTECTAEFHIDIDAAEDITVWCNRDEHPTGELHHDIRRGLRWQADSEGDPERVVSTATPELLADLFTDWAERDGILARITEEQCADLARAFGAGFMIAQGFVKARPSATA